MSECVARIPPIGIATKIPGMKIKLESVYVSDLDKALAVYTDVLGFVKNKDIPMGDTRFVTVVSPEEPDGTELLLEPNGEHPATKAFKSALPKWYSCSTSPLTVRVRFEGAA